MKFMLSEEHRAFAASLHDLLGAANTPAVVRSWAAGDHDAGLTLWKQLAALGVTALTVPEQHDGIGADAVDLAVAFTALGYHGVPGPWVESVAVLPALLTGELGERLLPRLAAGAVGTVAVASYAPLLLDADIADVLIAVIDGVPVEVSAPTTPPRASVDRTRRLWDVGASGDGQETAVNHGVLATAAQMLGAGRRLLDDTVGYATQRAQYGRAIGEYQAIKHLLADVATRLELATPLVHGAAVAVASGQDTATRDTSAAKVAAADAAYLSARTALQVHGAIGYTAEHDLGIWLTKVRALQSSWGTQALHRGRVLEALSVKELR